MGKLARVGASMLMVLVGDHTLDIGRDDLPGLDGLPIRCARDGQGYRKQPVRVCLKVLPHPHCRHRESNIKPLQLHDPGAEAAGSHKKGRPLSHGSARHA